MTQQRTVLCRVCCAVAVVLATLCVPACQTPPVGPERTPTYASLAETHNQRVQRLSNMYSRGVIELRWRDEDGRHFEQGNIDLWIDLPRRTALRVEKVGNVFLWLGSDQDRFWLFDMLSDDTVLHTAQHDAALDDRGMVLPIRPLALLDLVGLSELPDLSEDEPAVRYHEQLDAWVVTAEGEGGLMRLYLDRTSTYPVRAESLDDDGQALYASTMPLRRYSSVPRPGTASVGYGHMPTLIDIVATDAADTDERGVSDGEIKIALNSPTGNVENQPLDRVFDLSRLLRAMPPDYLVGETPADMQ